MKQQGGFAGAVGTDQCNGFVRRDGERNSVETSIACRVVEMDVAEFDGRRLSRYRSLPTPRTHRRVDSIARSAVQRKVVR